MDFPLFGHGKSHTDAVVYNGSSAESLDNLSNGTLFINLYC